MYLGSAKAISHSFITNINLHIINKFDIYVSLSSYMIDSILKEIFRLINGGINMQYAIIIIAALIILYLIGGYNSLVRLRNYVNESWSQIDTQLKRRYDLIPNLIETVKGYMNYEEKVLTEIVQARSMLLSGNREEAMDANNMISQSLKSLFAVSEAYPDLKANKNFLLLQEELSGTENKIAYARKHYNEVVRQYNIKVEMFPSNIIAGIFGFQKNVYFEVKEEEKEVPKVQF